MPGIDHVAVTVAEPVSSAAFDDAPFGAEIDAAHVIEGKTLVRRLALGGAVLGIRPRGGGVGPVARRPSVGAADIGLRCSEPVRGRLAWLAQRRIEVSAGPTPRETADCRASRSLFLAISPQSRSNGRSHTQDDDHDVLKIPRRPVSDRAMNDIRAAAHRSPPAGLRRRGQGRA
jgi:hypothetical protein